MTTKKKAAPKKAATPKKTAVKIADSESELIVNELDSNPDNMVGVPVRYRSSLGNAYSGQIIGHDTETGLTELVVHAYTHDTVRAYYKHHPKAKNATSYWEMTRRRI